MDSLSQHESLRNSVDSSLKEGALEYLVFSSPYSFFYWHYAFF